MGDATGNPMVLTMSIWDDVSTDTELLGLCPHPQKNTQADTT